MFDTLALLVSDILQGLGNPPREWLEPEDAVRAAIHTLAFYLLTQQQSAENRSHRNIEFVPAARDVSIQGLVADAMMVSFVERKFGSSPNDSYTYLHNARLSDLEEARVRGDERCCVYKQDDELRFRTTYEPNGTTHRIWYYIDPVLPQTLADNVRVPRFGPMFVSAGIVKAGTTMKMRMVQLPKDRRPDELQLRCINDAIAEAAATRLEWDALWKYDNQATKAPRGRNRRPVLAIRRGV